MIITVDVSREELNEVDLSGSSVEEIVWGTIGEFIDPDEVLNVQVVINVYA